MAQQVYRANLSAKSFPFLSETQGRSVIIKGADNTFNAQVASQEDTDKDVGIPQIYYCHNVIANANGFQSVEYKRVDANVAVGRDFTEEIWLRSDTGSNLRIAIEGSNIYKYEGRTWVPFVFIDMPIGQISSAYVSGKTYVWFQNYGCRVWDGTTFSSVILSGLSVPDIIGISSSYGYLIAWTKNSVAWSSTTSPTDFVPSLTTGAGGGSVEGVRGEINFCVPHTLGFIVYTATNTVAALYSGNSRYPFSYREIVNSGGCADSGLVTWDSNSGSHYAWTTSGIQLISTSQSQTIFPEVTDFLGGQRLEDFDESTDTFTTRDIVTPLKKKLSMVADRYLLISYGISELTHALVYDIALKRWGKLKITHALVFDFIEENVAISDPSRQSITFMTKEGNMYALNLVPEGHKANGVILFGKYQYVRSRMIQLDEIDVENAMGTEFSCKILTSIKGKDTYMSTPYDASDSGSAAKKYLTDVVGVNHSILFKGGFNLNTLQLTFHIHGKTGA